MKLEAGTDDLRNFTAHSVASTLALSLYAKFAQKKQRLIHGMLVKVPPNQRSGFQKAIDELEQWPLNTELAARYIHEGPNARLDVILGGQAYEKNSRLVSRRWRRRRWKDPKEHPLFYRNVQLPIQVV